MRKSIWIATGAAALALAGYSATAAAYHGGDALGGAIVGGAIGAAAGGPPGAAQAPSRVGSPRQGA